MIFLSRLESDGYPLAEHVRLGCDGHSTWPQVFVVGNEIFGFPADAMAHTPAE